LRQSKVPAFAVAILVVATATTPTTRAAAPRGSIETTSSIGPGFHSGSDGVRLRGRWFEEPVRRAVHGAARRLAEPSCAAVLGDFHDPAGRDLRQRLVELDVDPSSYTRMVLFYDGSSDAPCRRPRVYAFTAPGSRVVRICPTLGALVASAPEQAEAIVIHEVLHTLGLEENPPTSADITTAVEKRCRALVATRARGAR
jgi:hypothetical protein